MPKNILPEIGKTLGMQDESAEMNEQTKNERKKMIEQTTLENIVQKMEAFVDYNQKRGTPPATRMIFFIEECIPIIRQLVSDTSKMSDMQKDIDRLKDATRIYATLTYTKEEVERKQNKDNTILQKE